MPVIYSLSFPSCEKRYVGSTSKLPGRLAQHRFLLARGQHHSPDFQEAASRFGLAALVVEVLEEVDDAAQLLERERHWLALYEGLLFNKMAFPTRKGARMSADARAKISRSMIGNQFRVGIPHDEASRSKISDGLRISYATGRRRVALHPENLAEHNAAVARGDKPHPSRNPDRDRAITESHARTGSAQATAAEFNITESAVRYVVRRINPSQLRKWRRKCATR